MLSTKVVQSRSSMHTEWVKASDLNLPTLVALTAPALSSLVLGKIAAAGHAGVKPSHGYVIQRLVADEPTIGALAEALGMTQQGASKQVNDLEALGYVERLIDEDDHRVRYVRLTAAGRAVLTESRAAQAEIE